MKKSIASGHEENRSPSFVSADERTVAPEPRGLSLTAASAAFATLLLLALVWPDPVVWWNDVTFDAEIAIDDRSFLGREAPSWDMAFWSIAGLLLLAMFHHRLPAAEETWRRFRARLRTVGPSLRRQWEATSGRLLTLFVIASAIAVALTWVMLDAVAIAAVERLEGEAMRDIARIFNRLGGGMNPTMILGFFFLSGMAYRRLDWMMTAVAFVLTGLAGGAIVHILKLTVGRSRPEVWLGPFFHVTPPASSFPSGHTMSAFAIGGVLFFASRSRSFRLFALIVAICTGAARVFTFRHWPSDVLASALIGLLLSWFFVSALFRTKIDDEI